MIFDKRYVFASSVKNKILSQMLLLFSFVTWCVSIRLLFLVWYVSSKLSASIVALFCFLSIFVFCGKKLFSTKDISSALSVKYKMLSQMLLRFFPLINSRVSSKLVAFFHVMCFLRNGCFFHLICFIKTGCFFYVNNN